MKESLFEHSEDAQKILSESQPKCLTVTDGIVYILRGPTGSVLKASTSCAVASAWNFLGHAFRVSVLR